MTAQIGSLLEQNGFHVVHASRFFLEDGAELSWAGYRHHIEWWLNHICDLITDHKISHVCIGIYDNTLLLTVELLQELRKRFGESIVIIIGGPGASSFSAAEKRIGFKYGLWGHPSLQWVNRPFQDIVINSPNGHDVLLEIMKQNSRLSPVNGTEIFADGSVFYSPHTGAPTWSHVPPMNIAKSIENYPKKKKVRPFHSFTIHQECPAFWLGCVTFCGGQRSFHLNTDPGQPCSNEKSVPVHKITEDLCQLVDVAKTTFLYPSVPDISPPYVIDKLHKAITGNDKLNSMAKNKQFRIGSFIRFYNLMLSPEKYISKFKDINLCELYVGFENLSYWLKTTGDQTHSQKKCDEYLEKANETLKILQNNGINVEVNTVFGFQGETIDKAMVTVDWINDALGKGLLTSDLTMTSYSDLHNLEIPFSAYTKAYVDKLNDSPEDLLLRIGTDYPPEIFSEMINQNIISLEKLCKNKSTVERHIIPKLGIGVRKGYLDSKKIPETLYGESLMTYRELALLLAENCHNF